MHPSITRALTIAAAATFAAAISASAEIYEWVDSQGRHHYTQNLEDVPQRQRSRAEAAAGARPKLITTSPAAAGPRTDPAKIQPGSNTSGCLPGRTCRNGRPYDAVAERKKEIARNEERRETRARQQYRKLAAKVESLQQQVDSLEKVGADRAPGSRRSNVSSRNRRRYVARHAEYKKASSNLLDAKQALEDYEEEIRRAGLPPGVMR